MTEGEGKENITRGATMKRPNSKNFFQAVQEKCGCFR